VQLKGIPAVSRIRIKVKRIRILPFNFIRILKLAFSQVWTLQCSMRLFKASTFSLRCWSGSGSSFPIWWGSGSTFQKWCGSAALRMPVNNLVLRPKIIPEKKRFSRVTLDARFREWSEFSQLVTANCDLAICGEGEAGEGFSPDAWTGEKANWRCVLMQETLPPPRSRLVGGGGQHVIIRLEQLPPRVSIIYD